MELTKNVGRSDGMLTVERTGQCELREVVPINLPHEHGLVGWVLGLLRGLRSQREMQQRQLRLVETLSLGGKKQLMLITCAGESFLVGGGVETVETIVRVKSEASLDVAKDVDGLCR